MNLSLHQGLAALSAMVQAVTAGAYLLDFLTPAERHGLIFLAFVLSTGLAVLLGTTPPETPARDER